MPCVGLIVNDGKDLALATADAIVYATAVKHGAELLTCDAHFKDLPGVVLLPKSAAG